MNWRELNYPVIIIVIIIAAKIRDVIYAATDS